MTKNKNIILGTFFLIGISIIGIEFFHELQNSGWAKNELYISVFLNILYVGILSFFFRIYLKHENSAIKYVMVASLIISLLLYYYTSVSYDPVFPTLTAMNIVAIIYIVPGLIIIRGLTALCINIGKKNKSTQDLKNKN